jgi:hypothetical protein
LTVTRTDPLDWLKAAACAAASGLAAMADKSGLDGTDDELLPVLGVAVVVEESGDGAGEEPAADAPTERFCPTAASACRVAAAVSGAVAASADLTVPDVAAGLAMPVLAGEPGATKALGALAAVVALSALAAPNVKGASVVAPTLVVLVESGVVGGTKSIDALPGAFVEVVT